MLEELLTIPESISKEEMQGIFANIADQLFNRYEIVKGNKIYDFLEIEFYYYSKNHPDNVVYHHNVKLGRWHTHLSGMDISLYQHDLAYGGILIRSIIDEEGNVINGPLSSLFCLFNDIDVYGNSENLPIICLKAKKKNIKLASTSRYHIMSGEFEKKDYRFFNPSSLIKWKSGYAAKPHVQSK